MYCFKANKCDHKVIHIGVFTIVNDCANFNAILPWNNAAGNWSTAELMITKVDILSHDSSTSSDTNSDQEK